MLISRPPDIPSSEITDESLFWNRRDFLEATVWEQPRLEGCCLFGAIGSLERARISSRPGRT
jgi:hypothetical protein